MELVKPNRFVVYNSMTKEPMRNENGEIAYINSSSRKLSDKSEILSKAGFNPELHTMESLSSQSSVNDRKNRLHNDNINNHNWNNNIKYHELLNEIKNPLNANDKHILKYENNKNIGKTMRQFLDDNGYAGQYVTIDSQTKGLKKNKDKFIAEYKSNPNVKFIIIDKTGSTGLNLQNTRNTHAIEEANTAADQDQTIARGYRTGREKYGDDSRYLSYYTNSPMDSEKENNIKSSRRVLESIGDEKQGISIKSSFDKYNKKESNKLEKRNSENLAKKEARKQERIKLKEAKNA
jgi:hypothetical protein